MKDLSPETLPTGTVLGSWQLDGRAGYGAYGVVYRAHKVGQTEAQPVALKLARYPNDPRFEREAGLLAQIQHARVPCLLGRGTWKGGPRGDTYPYVVMQWVEGLRLYDWAKEHAPSSRQTLRLLAEVAWALEATHAVKGLHRDVKGDNILVSPEGHAFLMDFGCGTWKEAPPLTQGLLAPGTKLYRSAQALRFHWNHRHATSPQYQATPADDVYALGVTAYRLCTGIYPPLATDPSIVGDDGRDTREALVPPSQVKPMAPSLESFILRMLSDKPQERGSAGELAAAMEALAAESGTESAETARPSRSGEPSEGTSPPSAEARHGESWPMGLLPLVAGLLLAISGTMNLERLLAPPSGMRDGGTGGVADAAVEELPVPTSPREPEVRGLSLDMPKGPLPGQLRPPCPRNQINIKGGCWAEIVQVSPPCGESFYDWKGACYVPVAAPPRPGTSDKQ
ncbi:serine/threonine-protein kinase [Stigmatella aurantiaca]|uniref:Protein kinase n=1 Tax=Stigmatella aurantiaca (strain DW4/3-1) TaxID=378806 RepID=Q08W83_STIAD|nr:serine/threonine-protein kinase [Stigmatella aurantiaca]ADO71752.1 Protein kinase [Stigmatella aurantiaca DW4/3-1]EAU64746.1 protein kinase [Stigmatella aurantiaca DW4/3-1]